ncbi:MULTISPECIES: CTB family bacteriocin [unclassified Nostoc]|uniref:CTB family bacteriocin n=1 Tax=unclassified Nostoc TaxID=2593658 RepID=UPI002AD27FCA|nr:CTB family bacteriocin [Nostoc sp. ChiQUE02]MDZ8229531.1 CTB family bacteriocin [Nostoc sp. ChiQUE02]
MSPELFTDLSNEQQEVVAGGADFQLDVSFFAADENVLNGDSSSDPSGSNACSNGNSTDIKTAGVAFLGLGAHDVPDISKVYSY